MSHTSTVNAVRIVSIPALESAIASLNQRGVRCSLAQNVKPRAYFDNQQGMGVAPYVIKLDDASYDIGLYPATDGNGYEARTDFYTHNVRSVESVLGGRCTKAGNEAQAKLGKLYQEYGVAATAMEARKKGLSVQRVEGADGKIKLVLTGATL